MTSQNPEVILKIANSLLIMTCRGRFCKATFILGNFDFKKPCLNETQVLDQKANILYRKEDTPDKYGAY